MDSACNGSGWGWFPKEEVRVLRPEGKGRETRLAAIADAHAVMVSAIGHSRRHTRGPVHVSGGAAMDSVCPASCSRPPGSDSAEGLCPGSVPAGQ